MLNDLPIDQLRSLVTISETNSFTVAAGRLFRTQPALSLQIKKLEERVGMPLLNRNGRTIVVTEAGKVLVDYARRILDLNEEALAKLAVTETEGTVRVGVLEEVAIGPLVHLLTKFGRLCAKVHVELQVSTSWELARQIKSNDLCLAVANNEYSEQGTSPLWQETYLWAHNPTYDLLSLDSLPVVIDPMGYPCSIRECALATLEAQHRKWHVAFSSFSLTAMQAAVRAGLGVGLLPESALTSDMMPLDLPLESIPIANIALYRGSEANSPAVDTLANFLIRHLQTVPFLSDKAA